MPPRNARRWTSEHAAAAFPEGRCVIAETPPDATEQAELRGGRSPWFDSMPRPQACALTTDVACDALIVGCGITGSLMAERLTRQGLDVIVVDREVPGRGSTAASTAMLLWEIDRSLVALTQAYGFERASRAYHASLGAVRGLIALVGALGIDCDLTERPSLCLAAGADAAGLAAEQKLRDRAGLPGAFLDAAALRDRFAMVRPGAIVAPGSADANPVRLAGRLRDVALARGARLVQDEALGFDSAGASVGVGMASGRSIEARHVILATGYVRPDIVRSTIQDTASSWAIATKPQPDALWRDGAVIWEDSERYLYARVTATGRIIIGGEDSTSLTAAEDRDAAIPDKAAILKRKLQALWPQADTTLDYAWAGTFDTTKDGLPLIGRLPGHPHIHAAYGYGGNGITFSYMAAQLIGGLIAGETSPLLDDFALARDAPAALV